MTDVTDYDVVILGAGINGAGLFRDLCAQGVSCLIIDKADFGAGTSAASSRLIHGGIKYLETGEFRLVAQSTYERNLLLKNAPHFVKPLPTIIPFFSYFKGITAALRTFFGATTAPRARGGVLIKIGLSLYDFFGRRARVMPKHRLFLKPKILSEMPSLTSIIKGAGLYFDAQVTRPERLVLELIQDGLKDQKNSKALNYTSLIETKNNVLCFEKADGTQLRARAKLVVNATGPWIDKANEMLGETTQLIGGTKGAHILLKNDALVEALDGRMVYFEANDGRICLIFALGGNVLIGSTDIRADNPDNVFCAQEETDYLIESAAFLFPSIDISAQQIIYSYAGIRPLPASDAANPGLISRDHSMPILPQNADRDFDILNLVGGKWTTFRGFAEEAAKLVCDKIGWVHKQPTDHLAIGGGQDFPNTPQARAEWVNNLSQETGLPQNRIEILLDRYGTKARDFALYEAKNKKSARLPNNQTYTEAEIDFIIRNEDVQHPTDIVQRRTNLAMSGVLSSHDIKHITRMIAQFHHWPEGLAEERFKQTLHILENKHQMRF